MAQKCSKLYKIGQFELDFFPNWIRNYLTWPSKITRNIKKVTNLFDDRMLFKFKIFGSKIEIDKNEPKIYIQ